MFSLIFSAIPANVLTAIPHAVDLLSDAEPPPAPRGAALEREPFAPARRVNMHASPRLQYG